MMKRSALLLLLLTVTMGLGARERVYTLASPNGRLRTCIVASDGGVTYDLVCDGMPLLLPSPIGLDYEQGNRSCRTLTVMQVGRRTVDETVLSPFTRQAAMRDHYNELTLRMKEGVSLVFRAYDEGIAYRFRWDGEAGRVKRERVVYRFADDWNATVPYVISFDSTRHDIQYSTSFENQYTTSALSALDGRRLCFLPLVVHGDGGLKVCLTESSLLDYGGLYLHGTGRAGELVGEHAGLPRRVEQGGHNNLQLLVREREDYIAEMSTGKCFPWRIAMVGNSSQLAMNNMSYLLAEPSRVEDVGWIRPGKVAWEWWNDWNIGNVAGCEGGEAVSVDFVAGVNNDTYKHYIDFASRYGIAYVILDEGWAVNGAADLLQVVPGIDLPQLVQYGRQRGVGIILWAGYYAFERDMERVCSHYSEMGVKGFKIDFMDRDDQKVTDFYRRAAETCARYRLLVDFHGSFKPAGMNRTYPNVLNFEGVFGLEQMKWAPVEWDQVQYDTEIPFIRQAAGPMDYTPGAMRNATRESYRPCWSEPMSQGTRCHQLALYVVLEAPLSMLCDAPTQYEREPAYTRFLAGIPTVWDETRVLEGEVGQYIVTARRKGSTWYVAGITNWSARDVTVDLGALLGQQAEGQRVVCYRDGANAHRRGSDYTSETTTLGVSQLSFHMAPGGGFVVRIGE